MTTLENTTIDYVNKTIDIPQNLWDLAPDDLKAEWFKNKMIIQLNLL